MTAENTSSCMMPIAREALATTNANSPQAAMAVPTIRNSSKRSGLANTPVAS